MINLEKFFHPESWQIRVEDNHAYATIVDTELDPFECFFPGLDCVTINTSIYEEITLDINHLRKLIKLIKEVDKLNLNQYHQ
jgi:hypothetical protein